MSVLKEKKPMVALLESIRSIGYNFNTAMADIIDNSISAKASIINIYYVNHMPAIIISDNGIGMSYNELDLAMNLGSKNPNDERSIEDLGRFGLGLKSASFSQCRNLTVSSMKDGIISSMTWDLKLVQEKQSWVIQENDESNIGSLQFINELKRFKHGTIVQWSDFDRIKNSSSDVRLTISELLRDSSSYLALVFHKYISSGKVKIFINNNELDTLDPFLLNRVDTQQLRRDEIKIKNSKNQDCIIEVKPYILPFIKNLTNEDKRKLGNFDNLKNKQGFYIYRNNRLIIWGTWLHMIGVNELYKNARIEVNIPNTLDDVWDVDIKKASATVPSNIKAQLIASVKNAIGTSSKIYHKRGENRSKELGYEVLWNVSEERDSYEVKINRNHPLLNQFENSLTNEQLLVFNTLIQNIELNLPKMKIFTQIAESKTDKEMAISISDIKNEIIDLLTTMIDNTKEEKINFLELLFQAEPYCLHPELYEIIKEEINDSTK